MKAILLYLSLFFSLCVSAQNSINGNVLDEKATPLPFATVALLHPEDSTLAFFGISNTDGFFEIKNIKAGKYLLQTAFIGYRTLYKEVELPLKTGETLGILVMKLLSVNLTETEVSAERIPVMIKKDTIEYNAGAFKTKPDAATEDLLKKMPGIEVDRAGNIKAQGEDVRNVLVDGKEFFGNDPKVATKNLPADAIKKIQVYDKKSDESQLTGVDDGSHSKTINLVLKDDKKQAWFGDVLAGGGTDSHYQTSAKAFRFNKNSQFAGLAMLNNINQFGFSFKDYIDFNGGMGSLMNGDGNAHIGMNDNSFPINFGQPATGLITSGAGGLNYTYEKKKDNRFNISYLGNGADKKLNETTSTQNFTTNNPYTQEQSLNKNNKNLAHRFNLGWKNKLDSTQTIIINGNASYTNGKTNSTSFSESFLNDTVINNLNNFTKNNSNAISGNVHAAYMKKLSNSWKLFKISADGGGSHNLDKTQLENTAYYFQTNSFFNDQQFQNNKNEVINYSANTSIMRTLKGNFYIQPEISAGNKNELLKRDQGFSQTSETPIDSLSPIITTNYQWLRPAISFKRSSSKSQFNFTLQAETGKLNNEVSNRKKSITDVLYFTPRLSWNYEYKTSHRLGFYYESSVNTPNANQLLPVLNNINLLQLYHGNINLKPEYAHNINFNWILFDQFSFTSIFAGINGTYIQDKINWSRNINNDFSQSLTLVNVTDDYRIRGNIDYSTPVRALGITLNLSVLETWNQGINYVNSIQNINTNFIQQYSLSIDNRKKEKWDAKVGGKLQWTDAYYSVQHSLNTTYSTLSYFAELAFTPNTHWHFSASADVSQYNNQNFGQSINIPLLKAGISRYFLKANRGIITLEAFDILNKNTGIEQISELNYLQQKQSSIIGRYVMITFKYRLNKFDNKSNVNIKVNER
ncbi:MAG: outer membrane beta-barrel protein [Bacteroidetes bacterium]|nr:outer membrane beta-barrel protein [Bacteroidota bacterium]